MCVGRAGGSILERSEALVRLEALGKLFCALCTKTVMLQTANMRKNKALQAL